MISGSCFSTADLNSFTNCLYAKIKIDGVVIDVECLYEHGEEGTTDVRTKNPPSFITVKTKDLFDYQDSNKQIW